MFVLNDSIVVLLFIIYLICSTIRIHVKVYPFLGLVKILTLWKHTHVVLFDLFN